ncbi:MAG: MFS transporter [Aliishimia sp.]
MSRDTTSFGLIFLLWGAGLGAAAQYGKVSVIYDQLPNIYPGGGVGIAFLVSVVGFVGIVFGVVAGLIVARVGYRRALLWALWGGAVISAVEAVLPPLSFMLVLRVLEGISHLALVVAAPTLIAQLSAARHRGFTLTLWSTFFGVAFTVLVWGGLPMVDALGVPSLFAAHAVWMAAFAILLTLRLPMDAEQAQNDVISFRSILRDHMTIYRSPFIAAPGLGWLFYTFCFLAFLTLLPPFLADSERAFVLGSIPLVSIFVSMTLGVWLLRYISAVNVVLIGFATAMLCLIWLLFDQGGVVPCFALAGAFGLVQGASFAAVPQLNDTPATQANSNGAMAQMGNIGNTLGTPVLAALILIGGYDALIISSIVVMGAGCLCHLCMAHWRRIS